jgi:hypothetical protein
MAIDLILKSILFETGSEDAGLDVRQDEFGNRIHDSADPVGNFLEKTNFAALLKRPGVIDESWDAPLVKTVALPADFIEHSEQRLAKMRRVIERVFAGHRQEIEEAVTIANRALAEARTEILARAVA